MTEHYTVQLRWNYGWVTVTYPMELEEAWAVLENFRSTGNTCRLWNTQTGAVE